VLASVAPAKRFRLAMAIRTQHAQVFQTIIIPYAVDVIDLNCEGSAPPFADATIRTDIF